MKKSLAHLPTLKADEILQLLKKAYVGVRYNCHYKTTKEQLEQLAPCVQKLHEVRERIYKQKIETLGV